MVFKFFERKLESSGIKPKPNQQFPNELQKAIIKRFKRRRAYSLFKDNNWGADLADIQLISKCIAGYSEQFKKKTKQIKGWSMQRIL